MHLLFPLELISTGPGRYEGTHNRALGAHHLAVRPRSMAGLL